MSSFNKKGFRTNVRISGKYHAKSVNAILTQLDFVYEELVKQGDIVPSNLVERATPLMGRELDELELDILVKKFAAKQEESE